MGNIREINLPEAFLERMEKMLGEGYTDFISGYRAARLYGLRYNPLKAAKEEFLERMPFELTPVPWSEDGFYYGKPDSGASIVEDIDNDSKLQPGKHAFHEAGAYYIQEPSAMAVAEVLEPKPGEKILDLCAAPGGKTTHIAGKMRGRGLIVSNEIVTQRAKILSQNVERMGISNTVVCNEKPERLACFFSCFFDKVLVDAPCSGEGMFRKDETAVEMWSLDNVSMCASRQLNILTQAAKMLKAGGVLVYSTCTFSPEENEGVISEFLKEHEDFYIETAPQEKFFSHGEGKWLENPAKGIEHTMRLWPHKIAGEGHFIAKLRKEDGLNPKPPNLKMREGADGFKLCKDFMDRELGIDRKLLDELFSSGRIISFGGQVYLQPPDMISLQGIKVIRSGLHLGTDKKNRFEPSHALALYLSPDKVVRSYEMTQEQTVKYLQGETFACDEQLKGWILLTTGGYSIGFGKAGNGQMKNHYPKGLRKIIFN